MKQIAKRYKAMNFQKAPWELVEEELSKVDWDAMEDVLSLPTPYLSFMKKFLKYLSLSSHQKQKILGLGK